MGCSNCSEASSEAVGGVKLKEAELVPLQAPVTQLLTLSDKLQDALRTNPPPPHTLDSARPRLKSHLDVDSTVLWFVGQVDETGPTGPAYLVPHDCRQLYDVHFSKGVSSPSVARFYNPEHLADKLSGLSRSRVHV